MEDPCLGWHRDVVNAAGLHVVPVSVDEHGAQTDMLGDSDAGAVVLAPAHQFPLGAVLHPERRTAAITWARATAGLVIGTTTTPSCATTVNPSARCRRSTRSTSCSPELRARRSHRACGLAGSCCLARSSNLFVNLRRVEAVHVPAPDQLAFSELLVSQAFERHVRRMRARYRARRDRLLAMLAERAPTATPVGISAGLRVLLELPAEAPLRRRAGPARGGGVHRALPRWPLLPQRPSHPRWPRHRLRGPARACFRERRHCARRLPRAVARLLSRSPRCGAAARKWSKKLARKVVWS